MPTGSEPDILVCGVFRQLIPLDSEFPGRVADRSIIPIENMNECPLRKESGWYMPMIFTRARSDRARQEREVIPSVGAVLDVDLGNVRRKRPFDRIDFICHEKVARYRTK